MNNHFIPTIGSDLTVTTLRNLSSNFTLETSKASRMATTSFEITKISFYFVILLFSSLGNGMVAYIICSRRKMRTASNYLILNLAICDFLTPLLSIPFDFALEKNEYLWLYGAAMCKLLWPAATYTTTSSAFCLAVISLDRYRIIMHPYKTRLSTKQVAATIAASHILSIACVVPYSHVLHLQSGLCQEGWRSFSYRQAYTAILFLVQYALPLVFMIIMYTLALIQLYHSYGRTFHMRSVIEKNNYGGRTSETGRKLSRARTLRRSLSFGATSSANVRATKMFLVVVTVFSIFMLPNQVIWLWADFGGGSTDQPYDKIVIICWLFTYTNCVCNPFIFAIFSHEFRHGFKQVFRPSYLRLRESLSRGSKRQFLSRVPKSFRSQTKRKSPDEAKTTGNAIIIGNNMADIAREDDQHKDQEIIHYRMTVFI
ncbi:neuropeptide FF receptor 2 [Nematostella vectensis]|uniref:neuropeptide FF receptor 2 n=1 Tax=Nematostella vectensis TaxID=45351 RepID=UPI00138F9F5F|nr:neuropeptide FF receptor 2 [Nematostella vectensis]